MQDVEWLRGQGDLRSWRKAKRIEKLAHSERGIQLPT